MNIKHGKRTWSLTKVSLLLITAFLLLLSACSSNDSNQNDEDSSGKTEVTYASEIEDILANNCLTCHGEGSEFPMQNYDNLMVFVNGDDTGALMRRLDNGENTDDGEPGNMYTHLGETDEEREENLATIKEWIGGWTLKRSDEITDDELDSIKAVEK